MSWAEHRLEDFIDIRHGFAFKSKFYSDSGNYILLTPGNCHESGGLKLKGSKEKYYVGEIPGDYLLRAGDLLVVMTDLVNSAPILGGSFIIPEDDRFLHNQRLGLVSIKDPTQLDKKFLYYLLNTHSYRGQVRGSASGATVRHTSPTRIKSCKVKVPETLDEQRSIASVLSAFDELIENNRRRIQLLEGSARLLYKEWFIQFRFPGHEHFEVIDGVPEGWERREIGEIAPFSYGKALKKDDRIPGPYPVYGSSGVVGSHEKAFVTGPTIIVGRKGNVGSVYWSQRDCHPIDTVYYVPSERCSVYLYYAILHTHFINTDVAVPGLNRDFAHSREILVPADTVLHIFDETIAPVSEQVRVLNAQNEALSKARELLLPRLMNGQVAV